MTQQAERSDKTLVLIVDDNKMERLIARHALEQAGFMVIEAENGKNALTVFAQHQPDLILLDVVMPELDGFDTCVALRRLPTGGRVPIIMNTSLEDIDSIEKAYQLGATDFITKPIHPTLLVYRIRHALRTLRDMEELRRAEERIQQLAYFDEITGLPNRTYLRESLQKILARAQRYRQLVAIYFLDLDQFKLVNDTFGHSAGDELLKQVAARLFNCIRGNDAIARPALTTQAGQMLPDDAVIRLGGDEFVIVAADIRHSADAAILAQRIIDLLTPPFTIEQHEVFITTSIGISLYPDSGSDPETLLRNADAAMYHAKEQGRNGYRFFSTALNSRIRDRLALKNELSRAIEQDELTLHYQPRLELHTGSIVGAEALVRWQHPQRGLIAPGEFIPLAEETGLILPLGDWVMRHACQQLAQWRANGLVLNYVSVNFSAAQFNQKSIHERISAMLKTSGLLPQHLELELTESILIEAENSRQSLEDLKAICLHISIDDFGTGYSSLSYLKRFPLDALKIDRSFISDIDSNSDGAAIVAATIALAHNLQLKVVAEGVEKESQLAFLRERGCDEGQGYLFSKPLEAQAFAEKLRAKPA
jgi:predicted signal transduction protein with EAL and GGDEF domain